MTAKETRRRRAQKDISRLHKKYYGKKKAKAEKETPITITGEYTVACQEYAKSTEEMSTARIIQKARRALQKDLPKGATIRAFDYKETDSANITHAVAYYHTEITIPPKHLGELLSETGILAGAEQKFKADDAPGATKTAGVDTNDQENKGNGKVTRKELMQQAQGLGIKYFRILHRDELEKVLTLHKEDTAESHTCIQDIQNIAQARWKGGWGHKGGQPAGSTKATSHPKEKTPEAEKKAKPRKEKAAKK